MAAGASAPASAPATSPGAPDPPVDPHREMHRAESANWLEEWVFGMLDGVITALALVVTLGLVLDEPTHDTFLTIMAAAVAGTLSMYVGALLSARSRTHVIRSERAREEWEVDHVPEIERREVEEIYRNQGFSPAEVKILTDRVTADKKRWVDMMMRDELGLIEEGEDRAGQHAAIIGFSYLIGAGLLSLPFLFASTTVGSIAGHAFGSAFVVAMALGSLILASVGLLESRFGGTHPLRGAAEMIAIGLATALAVFVVTILLTPA